MIWLSQQRERERMPKKKKWSTSIETYRRRWRESETNFKMLLALYIKTERERADLKTALNLVIQKYGGSNA